MLPLLVKSYQPAPRRSAPPHSSSLPPRSRWPLQLWRSLKRQKPWTTRYAASKCRLTAFSQGPVTGPFLCARHVYRADGLRETLPPNQREGNQQARAPLATVGSEGSRGGALEHSASEPKLACRVGNLAKNGEAR